MRVHVVVNAVAGAFRRAPAKIDAVREVCGSEATLSVTKSLEELRVALQDAHAAGAEVVALCGGDGTHMEGASGLALEYGDQAMPLLCLVRGGNAGTVARNWNRKFLEPQEHVHRMLQLTRGPGGAPYVRRCSLRVEDATGRRRVGFIFGTGLIAAFFKEFYAAGGGGYPEAAKLISRVFFGSFVGGGLARKVLSPMPCELRLEGETHPAQGFTLIAASVVRDLGMHMLVTHRAGEDPVRPHVVAFNLSVPECGKQYWRILAGRPLKGDQAVDTLVKDMTVSFPEGTGAYVLDGDLIQSDRVEVRAGPELKIIVI